ncbi:hypothetical protein JVU11DRAFT_2208 [Chiua virens]|nr:hypothetical protein JVU11DRAFT_2208 [Chiua virens]
MQLLWNTNNLFHIGKGLHFKNTKGFKVLERKTFGQTEGHHTKVHRDVSGLLRLSKKKYNIKVQDGPTNEDLLVPSSSTENPTFDDVEPISMDTLPPDSDIDAILGEEPPRRQYASVSGSSSDDFPISS